MKSAIARFLRGLANWLEGDAWDYDEFSHGYEEGIKRGIEYEKSRP